MGSYLWVNNETSIYDEQEAATELAVPGSIFLDAVYYVVPVTRLALFVPSRCPYRYIRADPDDARACIATTRRHDL